MAEIRIPHCFEERRLRLLENVILHLPHLTRIHVDLKDNSYNQDPRIAQCVSKLRSLKDLYTNYQSHIPAKFFTSFPRLKILFLRKATLNDSDWGDITSLQFIEELSLSNCYASKLERFSCLSNFSLLTRLNVYSCVLRDEDLSEIVRCPVLRHLHLSFCGRVQDGFSLLSALKPLVKLEIEHCRGLTDDSLSSIAAMPSLVTLSIEGCDNVTHKGFGSLSQLKTLVKLNVRACPGINDASLAGIALCPSLRVLYLGNCTFTDIGVSSLSKLATLKEIDFSPCIHVTDATLAILAGFSALEALVVTDCRNTTEEGFSCLAQLKSLIHLNAKYSFSFNSLKRVRPDLRINSFYGSRPDYSLPESKE